MQKLKTILFSNLLMPNLLFSSLLSVSTLFYAPVSYAHFEPLVSSEARTQAMHEFIQKMVREHDFNESELTQLLNQAKSKEIILEKISKPAEKMLPWFKYKSIFLTQKRVEEGVQFWKKHQKTLSKAHKKYGVPPEIIVSIIGVETFYGKQQGTDRVLDALVTLGFEYPPRAAFFRSELEAFLLMTREENIDPTQLYGSYAGAMGMPQFISSSYRNFAVDFSGKGKRDIINDTQDAIGSVANYFLQAGWKANEPVMFRINNTGFNHYITSLKTNPKNPEPLYTLESLYEQNVQLTNPAPNLSPKTRVAIIPLEEQEGMSYWLGLNNFYVITRYNNSNLYAKAVFELSEKIKALKEKS